ncbi:MAG: chemotaxis protein CheA [Deltaproteobacteria bacterium]|nr:chemotaxis protein CheA [Deltaproteobacteria bacterium]
MKFLPVLLNLQEIVTAAETFFVFPHRRPGHGRRRKTPAAQAIGLLLRCTARLVEIVKGLKGDLEARFPSSALIDELKARIADPATAGIPAIAPAPSAAPAPTLATPAPAAPAPALVPAPVAAALAESEHTRLSQSEPQKKVGATSQDESIRVSLSRLERLLNNVGELVIHQTVLNEQRAQVAIPLVQGTISQLAKITKEIQELSMGLRMVPLKQTFQRMQRVVRDTSAALGKEVEIKFSGEETELDKTVLENLGDPLVHMIRNAIDHGLETPDERAAAGKPRCGLVQLRAYHMGGKIVIEVSDDGHGLNGEKIRAKAIQKGLISADRQMSETESQNLIFLPGFSTKTEVSEVSGRGVGMDVVKNNVETLMHGEVQLDSKVGRGTCVRLLLPLTLAIVDGMVVRIGDERYIIPLSQVFESVQPSASDVYTMSGTSEVLDLRGVTLPMHRLGRLLGRQGVEKPPSELTVVIANTAERPFGILVDRILGQQQVVIKQLGREIHYSRGITGAAILGDGKAALILDLIELVQHKSALGGAGQTRGVA